MVRLSWQLKSDELLLAERVVDVVASLNARDADDAGGSTTVPFAKDYPVVKLLWVEAPHDDKVFPWRVLIETYNPDRYREALPAIADWLGIGVDLAPAVGGIRLQGQCAVGGFGLLGVVGGMLHTDERSYGVTCSHVLSKNCGSAIVRRESNADEQVPDAALIRQTECFEFPRNGHGCSPAGDQDLRSCMKQRGEIYNRHPRSTKVPGFIYARVHEYPMGNALHRFPHLLVMPRLVGFAVKIFKPFTNRVFSKPGDSGSWVFDKANDHWLGMLVGGEGDFQGSIVVEAGPLLEYLKLRLAADAERAKPAGAASLGPVRVSSYKKEA